MNKTVFGYTSEEIQALEREHEENEKVESSFFYSEITAMKKGEEAFCMGKFLPRMKEEAMSIAKKHNSGITVNDYGDDYYGILVDVLHKERTAKRTRKRAKRA
jgi:hypothetical protein